MEESVISKPVIYRRTVKNNREIADVLLKLENKYGKQYYLPSIFWGRNAWYMSSREKGETVKKIKGRIQSREKTKKLESGEILKEEVYEISVSTFEEVV